jgi:hypothetical protein
MLSRLMPPLPPGPLAANLRFTVSGIVTMRPREMSAVCPGLRVVATLKPARVPVSVLAADVFVALATS